MLILHAVQDTDLARYTCITLQQAIDDPQGIPQGPKIGTHVVTSFGEIKTSSLKHLFILLFRSFFFRMT